MELGNRIILGEVTRRQQSEGQRLQWGSFPVLLEMVRPDGGMLLIATYHF